MRGTTAMGIGKQETVTFEQFQATRKKVTGKDMNDEPMDAYTYLDTFEEGDEPWEALHIEICDPEWDNGLDWGSKYAGEGKYYILIGTFDWRTDDLESLERRLYKWAVSEEYCHDPSPKTYEFEWSRVCSESGESTVEAADIVEALEEAADGIPDEAGAYDREETIHRIREEGTEEWIDLVDGNLPVAPQPTVEEEEPYVETYVVTTLEHTTTEYRVEATSSDAARAEIEDGPRRGGEVVGLDCEVVEVTSEKPSAEQRAAILAWRVNSDATARAWLAMLVAADLAWHMDDSPGSIVCPWITDNAVRLGEQRDAMWQYFDGDPHGFMLDALGEGATTGGSGPEKEAS
jgi:hypothetical protein